MKKVFTFIKNAGAFVCGVVKLLAILLVALVVGQGANGLIDAI